MTNCARRKEKAKNPISVMIVGTNMMSIYSHRLELIKELLSLGFRVIVVAPGSGEEKLLEQLGGYFIDTPVDNRGTNIKHDLQLIAHLIHIIKKVHPQVVLTFYTKTNIYGGIACRLTGTPYIENITGLGSAVSGGGIMQKFMLFLYGQAVKSASMVFFQNTSNQQFFNGHHIAVRNSHLLPGSGVSLERFTLLPYPKATAVPEVVFISRILREKGIEQYVDAAKIVKETYPDVVFHVVGPCDAEYESYIETAVREGIIQYHGKVFDVKPFIERSQCTVFPSFYAEGMANVLLESAACGRPIITTSLPGCGEVVDDGVTGYVVRAQDTSDLADKMLKFLRLTSEERVAMGLNGRKKMEREFDRRIVIQAYVDAINDVVK
jgi:galacturonosyltransferase